MKHFLRDILYTSLFCTFLIIVLEYAIYKTPNEYSYKNWYMIEKADEIKVLLLGNSLFANSLDPNELGDSVFDGATDGRKLYYDVEIMKKYVPQMNNLKIVLIPLVVNMYGEPPASLYTQFLFARNMGIPIGNNPLQYSALLSGHFIFNEIKPINIYSEVDEKSLVKKKKHNYIDSIGYSPLFWYWDRHSISAPIRNYEEIIQSKGNYINQIKEMAVICDSLDVRLICIMPPANDAYNRRVGQQLFEMLDSTMSYLHRVYNIEYRLYYNDPDFREDSLYADELHLNYHGASLFAQRVKKDFSI